MLRTLMCQLVDHGRLTTTLGRARELVRWADGAIRHAMGGAGGGTHAGRERARNMMWASRPGSVRRLLVDIAPALREQGRAGGWTRAVRAGRRRGDGAPMAHVEVVGRGAGGERGAGGGSASPASASAPYPGASATWRGPELRPPRPGRAAEAPPSTRQRILAAAAADAAAGSNAGTALAIARGLGGMPRAAAMAARATNAALRGGLGVGGAAGTRRGVATAAAGAGPLPPLPPPPPLPPLPPLLPPPSWTRPGAAARLVGLPWSEDGSA